MDKISLIVPCYNEQDTIPFLREELNRIMSSFEEVSFEVILVDNCSEDSTLSLMKKYMRKMTVINIFLSQGILGKILQCLQD